MMSIASPRFIMKITVTTTFRKSVKKLMRNQISTVVELESKILTTRNRFRQGLH